MFLLSSKSGGMKTQTMSLGFQCSNCPFKSSSKKGIKVWKTSFESNLKNAMQFLKVHENRIHGKDKQVFGTSSSSAATSSSVQHRNPSSSIWKLKCLDLHETLCQTVAMKKPWNKTFVAALVTAVIKFVSNQTSDIIPFAKKVMWSSTRHYHVWLLF